MNRGIIGTIVLGLALAGCDQNAQATNEDDDLGDIDMCILGASNFTMMRGPHGGLWKLNTCTGELWFCEMHNPNAGDEFTGLVKVTGDCTALPSDTPD